MQQRAPLVRDELQQLGSQQLWDLARKHAQNEGLLMVIHAILLPRRTGLAARAVRWIEEQLLLIRTPASIETPRGKGWTMAALLTAGALAIYGGIAHGVGISIWHGLIRPLFGMN